MADKDVAGVRATIDAWLDAWTFGEHPWSIEKFEKLLDEDAMVIDDYGGKLSLLHGHKDYRSVWGGLVNATMRQWAIKAEEDSFQVWVDRDIAVENALLDMTNRDDIVLDPFLGSGSTLIAAERTGRCCRGLELDPRYVDVIVRRYHEVSGEQGILRDTGETFEEIAKLRQREEEATM